MAAGDRRQLAHVGNGKHHKVQCLCGVSMEHRENSPKIMARRHTRGRSLAKIRQGQKMPNDGRPMVEVTKELQIS